MDELRELDVKVAEARGWTWWLEERRQLVGLYSPKCVKTLHSLAERGLERELSPSEAVKYRRYGDWDQRPMSKWLPYFSTNIADAWVLVEEMAKTERIELRAEENERWCYGWPTLAGTRMGLWFYEDTAPEAICRAYLRWKGVE